MEEVARDILKYRRTEEIENHLMPIRDIISLIDQL